jgi:rubrerythrin
MTFQAAKEAVARRWEVVDTTGFFRYMAEDSDAVSAHFFHIVHPPPSLGRVTMADLGQLRPEVSGVLSAYMVAKNYCTTEELRERLDMSLVDGQSSVLPRLLRLAKHTGSYSDFAALYRGSTYVIASYSTIIASSTHADFLSQDEVFKCSVCLEEKEYMVPMFSCNIHVFCHKCCFTMAQDPETRCPLCRSPMVKQQAFSSNSIVQACLDDVIQQ